MGAVTPLGLSVRETWERCLRGESGVGKITLFNIDNCPVQFAGEVKNLDVVKQVGPFYPRATADAQGDAVTQACHPKDVKKMGRFIHHALVAGIEAYADSGLDAHRKDIHAERIGANIGVGMGGLPEIENVHNSLLAKGYGRITPFFIPQVIPNLASGQLSMLLNFKGPGLCNVTACSSSAHAIGESAQIISRGDADVMMAGGAECVICPLGIGGFAAMRALSTRNDAPEKASRPFDKDRDGFVMGEGAAVLILEEYEHAKMRGAKIYAELCGYGLSSDAYHITAPSPDGEGGYRAMAMAVKQAGISPDSVGYINAHGTSTPAGDAEEARAVRRLFPNGPKHLNVSSTKSMTGHLLGAAGAVEGLFCTLAIQEGKIPPTINLENLDPICAETELNFTPNQAVTKQVEYALSNSFGFGGTNASLLFGKVR